MSGVGHRASFGRPRARLRCARRGNSMLPIISWALWPDIRRDIRPDILPPSVPSHPTPLSYPTILRFAGFARLARLDGPHNPTFTCDTHSRPPKHALTVQIFKALTPRTATTPPESAPPSSSPPSPAPLSSPSRPSPDRAPGSSERSGLSSPPNCSRTWWSKR